MENALEFLAEQLNQFIKHRFQLDENFVETGRLKRLDGAVPQENENKLILSLVNISLENNVRFAESRMGFAASEKFSKPALLNMNLTILLAANFDDEIESLKFLKSAISYFHANPQFDGTSNSNFPVNLAKINLEPINLSLPELESVWNSINCSAVPSMLYKLRVFELSDDDPTSIVSPVEGTSNLK